MTNLAQKLSLLALAVLVVSSFFLPGARGAEISLDITSYPREIMVERGGSAQFDVRVENKGSIDLHNVSVRIENATFAQILFVPESVSIFSSKSAQTFHVNIMVPSRTSSGSYPVYLRAHSNELEDEESPVLKVFDLRAELVLYKLQFLRRSVLELEKKMAIAESDGKNIYEVSELLRKTNTAISVSEQRLYDKRYDDALLAMADAENVMGDAGADIETILGAGKTSSGSAWVYVAVAIIALLSGAGIFVVLRNRAARDEADKFKLIQNTRKLAVAGASSKQMRDIRDEIDTLRGALALVESEHDEALMSHDSYLEMKGDLESRIAKLAREIEKIERGESV